MKDNIQNEMIVYQPDSKLSLEVRVENETVWLNRTQIASLFDRDVKTIGKHIKNALAEELEGLPTVAKFATVGKEGDRIVTRQVEHYNLDVIISVGYRVKSKRGILFRAWANKVLKQYLLRGYAINERMLSMEERIDHRLSDHDNRIDELEGKVDFFLNTSLPPREGILFNGQIFDAHKLINDLIRHAQKRIILIDNYVDYTVLTQLDNRRENVNALIYTHVISNTFKLALERHNSQYPHIEVKTINGIHDRFLIIDENLYHIGASIKDLGKKLFAFSKLGLSPDIILNAL